MATTLKLRQKLSYGAGDIGFSLTSTILGVYFLFYLVEVVGFRPALAGAVIFFGETWDYVNDPLFGYLSDRTRSRWGRRRPFLLFGAPLLAATFALLWWRPPLEATSGLVLYYLLAYMLFEAAATLCYMPYFALTPELTEDYDERTSLTSYRMLFSIIGSLVAFTVPLLIIGSFHPENASKVLLMGAIFGAVSAVPLLVAFLGTRERPELAETSQTGLRSALKAALKNRPFLYGLAMFLATWIPISIVQTVLLFFIRHVVQREAQANLFLASIFVTAIIALPLWTWVSQRWGKRWAYILGVAFWALVQLVLITLTSSAATPFILILCILAGVGVAAAHVLPWSIIPDTIEWGEWLSGERHEGMFYSLVTLSHKAGAAIAIALTGVVLDLSGYVPNAVEQSASAIAGIRLAIGPLPALLLVLGILVALRYPLDRKGFNDIVAELRARRDRDREA